MGRRKKNKERASNKAWIDEQLERYNSGEIHDNIYNTDDKEVILSNAKQILEGICGGMIDIFDCRHVHWRNNRYVIEHNSKKSKLSEEEYYNACKLIDVLTDIIGELLDKDLIDDEDYFWD